MKHVKLAKTLSDCVKNMKIVPVYQFCLQKYKFCADSRKFCASAAFRSSDGTGRTEKDAVQ